MGQSASLGLTQQDVEEVIDHCGGSWRQDEVEELYRRFRTLDREHKGYLSSDEFLAIPELSINPVAQRLVRIYASVNFKEFAKLLSAFSDRAPRDTKLEYMFMVYDVDGDGVVSREDMTIMLTQLAGSSLGDDDMRDLVEQVMSKIGSSAQLGGINLAAFKKALGSTNLDSMVVNVPVE
ncbi:hypothetical protein FOA52_002936 [Chlamydomonas sp. UWO 241]|nr:hypothetical protein FOA52_002936 [Chlamydomonas sp. UWO 241]